ncbi:MAG: NAD(P)H-binding protein [Myxococcales bacterium]|nr:NAD(P)H-binding protein [Myxococcales bacterium]
MKLLVVGGTGRTGLEIVRAAVDAGHQVAVLARSADTAELPDGVERHAASAVDADAVGRAVAGVDAVITALSIPRSSRSPFAPVTGPTDLHSRSARLLLEAMAHHGVDRLVKISAQGVGDSAPRAGLGFRLLVALSNLRPAFADHAVADELVMNSPIRYTILRPPILAQRPPRGSVVAAEDVRTASTTRVSIADLAVFAVTCLDDPSWFGRCVSVR